MKPLHLSSWLVAAATLTLGCAARADETLKFSDPTKPGIVKIVLAHGDIQVRGADTAEVVVKSEVKPRTKAPRKDGLRELASSSTFSLSEKDNVITLDGAEGWPTGGNSDFSLTVPRNTSVVVQKSFGGDVTCNGLSGDIEIHSLNGEVHLDDISGGVIVEAMNGAIHANVRELVGSKPLSFTSMNGEVLVRVPADAKANIRLRTQNGAVLTDFPENTLVTKTESTPGTNGRRSSRNGGVLPNDAREAIRDSVRMAVQIGQEAAEAAREGLESARAKANADRERVRGTPGPVPPIPPMPSIPTPTGGKLVTGTLNGGGPEISVATMNGDVVVRQLEKK